MKIESYKMPDMIAHKTTHDRMKQTVTNSRIFYCYLMFNVKLKI